LAPLKWFCISLLLLLGLILAAWTIDWIFVSRVWPEGLARLQSILNQDLARTNHIECWCDDLPKLAAGTANFLYASLFQVTGIHDMGARFAEGAALSIPDTIVRKTYIANYEAIQVAMVGTQLFGVRLATLAMALPLFALVFSVALTDGLVQRAIRRASSGRESASLYHRAKHLQVLLLTACGAISLLLPLSIEPRWIWGPSFVVLAILARLQWAYYKKHL
jgi:integrating conjugative element membrane protein (TIGR03747 family)